ncbi:VOC family protein [Frankia sp. CNm7]|uniref:VOC family protein n=1 Tax=Frankia nepalensis TaxID=1836974 RepID=A0A937RR26_9ACTN|nr:VOC family protein [Frankia nepalensis]MBL7497388.1 VOC family protein [Frankia nepalensis]MBL7512091.1 VOC family protein [Frankia nepalensis]MBL7523257.1 VOC family protein [Frankia nepalensis]MBL7631809.1 VOC family protein [Frankia nepalensis]
MALTGVSHLSLTVTDLDRSAAWYGEVLDWKELVRDRGDTTTFAHGVLPGGLSVVLRQHDQGIADAFDETRPGLDHLSFSVEEPADLERLEARLTEAGAVFTPTRELPFGRVLAFRDPDNIALEAFLGA